MNRFIILLLSLGHSLLADGQLAQRELNASQSHLTNNSSIIGDKELDALLKRTEKQQKQALSANKKYSKKKAKTIHPPIAKRSDVANQLSNNIASNLSGHTLDDEE